MDAALRAVAHPGRRAILRLVWTEELTSGEIARQVKMSPPATSQHLKLLREAGLVRVRVQANQRLYRADQAEMAKLRTFLDQFWADPLERLKTAAEARATSESAPTHDAEPA
ncbi:MAG: ArsR/SmtB family transcription factor [Chloroflexota bacterium]